MYKIADLYMDFSGNAEYVKKLCRDFLCEEAKSDIKINISDEDIKKEGEMAEEGTRAWSVESAAANRKIAEILPLYNGFLLHSAVMDVDGMGIAFAARSGTGKTTHLTRWQSYLGEKLTVINGDKPFVRFFEGEPLPVAYGTPWRGKENFGNTGKTKLKHICFIERGAENKAERMDKTKAADLLFMQIYMPQSPVAAANTLMLINKLVETCEFWNITCNMDDNAAEMPYKTIFGR